MSAVPSPPRGRPVGSSARALRRLSRGDVKESTTAAPVQAIPDRFWRAVADTHLYIGPLGAKCGDVSPGTVCREVMRYLDPFDSMWIAVNADDETVVWLQRYNHGQMTEERVPLWEPVSEEGDDSAAGTPTHAEEEEDVPIVDLGNEAFKHPLQLLESDLTFYSWYLQQKMKGGIAAASVSVGSARDWNHEYQDVVERILFNTENEKGDALRQELNGIVSDFANCVQEAATTIVREMFLASNQKTIQKCPNAVDVYFHKNIMVRLCVDTAGGVYGGDAAAMKAATQANRANVILANEAPKHFLHVPMSMMITYRGYRIRATSIPPVTENSVVFGAAQFGTSRAPVTPFVQSQVEACGKALNLKPHQIAGSEGILSPFPVEAQVATGLDERLYLLNCGRLLPPFTPSIRSESYNPITAGFTKRVRPELISELDRAVSNDAFFPGCCNSEDNNENVIMTQWVRDAGIPTLAAIMGLMEGFNSLGNHHHPDTEMKKKKKSRADLTPEEMLTFVVCRNDEECCRVSAEKCYELTMQFATASTEEEYEAAANALVECVKCDAGARNINGFGMKPDVTQLFHMNGVPLRFMSYVYNALPRSSAPCTGHFLEVEIIARAAKNILFRKLRVCRDDEELHTLCSNFYRALLQPQGELAEGFWSDELGPEIQRVFHVFVPFDTSKIDTELVYDRVSDLTGVRLSPESVASLNSEEPTFDLHLVHPVMKAVHLPELVVNVGGHEPQLKASLESLLLFWTNYSTREDEAEKRLVEQEFSKKVPKYMKAANEAPAFLQD